MVVDSKGTPWFVQFAVNKLSKASIRKTMVIKEYAAESGDAAAARSSHHERRCALVQRDYSRGYLGRFDPKTGKATEWPSPGGPKSRSLTASRR